MEWTWLRKRNNLVYEGVWLEGLLQGMHPYENCYCKLTVFVLPVWFWPSQAKLLFLYYILDCDIRVTCHRLCTCEVSIKGLLGQKLLHHCQVLFFVCYYPVNGGPQGIELFCVS